MTQQSSSNETRTSAVKIAFGAMALVCLVAGLVIYQFAEQFGFSEETAQIVAIAVLAAGAGDYLVLKFWDRVAGRR